MIDFLIQVFWETWNIFKQASIFLLVGFLLAGVLAVLIPEKALSKLLGRGKVKSVLWASAIGAPLPLCSCGVVPAALGLHRQGATPGATAAFLIATPETGLDSISLSYALMDPIITVFRPVAAVLTAIVAGLGINLTPGGKKSRLSTAEGESTSPHDSSDAHSDTGAHTHVHEHSHDHAATDARAISNAVGARGIAARIYHYAFQQLLDDTSHWILLGIVLSGVVAAALPAGFFERYLSGEFASMLVMLAIGVPIYVCASEATPLAAALVLKGLNPGAALVFLLAGPATNIGSIIVLLRFLGARATAIYLGSIVVVALAAGYALNWVYRIWALDPRATFGKAIAIVPEPVKIAAAVLLIVLLVLSMRRAPVPLEWVWLRDQFARFTGVWLNAARLRRAVFTTALLLYLASGLFSIQPGEVAVKSRFGKMVAELAPGLHYRLPWPFETHRVVAKTAIRRMVFGFSSKQSRPAAVAGLQRDRMTPDWNALSVPITATGVVFQKEAAEDEPFLLTGDGNLINLKSAVQYRVNDASAYLLNVADPDALVRTATRAALGRTVSTSDIDAIYTSARSAIEAQVSRSVQETLNKVRSGIEIVGFRLLYVHAPDEVHDAFRDVASAQEDKLRTVNRARTFAVETVNQAKGEARAMLEQALAFKEQQIKHAEGEAASFAVRLDEYQRTPELTKFRLQLETIEEVLPGVQKFVRPGAGEMKDFDMWLLQPVGPGRGK